MHFSAFHCSCSGLVDTGDGQCRCLSGRSKDVEGCALFWGLILADTTPKGWAGREIQFYTAEHDC